jgi:hypothetical protein
MRALLALSLLACAAHPPAVTAMPTLLPVARVCPVNGPRASYLGDQLIREGEAPRLAHEVRSQDLNVDGGMDKIVRLPDTHESTFMTTVHLVLLSCEDGAYAVAWEGRTTHLSVGGPCPRALAIQIWDGEGTRALRLGGSWYQRAPARCLPARRARRDP